MKATISQIQSGFSKWYAKEIATMGWKTMFATPLVELAVANTLQRKENVVKMIADSEGYIDVDILHREYAEIINKAGSIELFGLRFTTQDLDKLYEAVKKEVPTKAKE